MEPEDAQINQVNQAEVIQTEIAILVDGNNFYKGLEKSTLHSRFNLGLFDYEKLANFIAAGRKIATKRFYKGVIKKEVGNEKSERMVSEQQRIFSTLDNNHWQIKRGKMTKNSEFGFCGGFYFLNQKIENKEKIKFAAEEILKKHQYHYQPIIIISQNENEQNTYKKLEQALIDIKDDGKGLKSLKGICFALNRWKEKGVDVKMAIDMLDIAYANKLFDAHVNTIIIVSSDSDLKPVVERVQELGINVEYVGFAHMYSIALLNIANDKLLLTEKQLEEFLPQTLI